MRMFLVIALAATPLACGGDDGSGPDVTGSLQVTIGTSGDTLDPDGYTVTLDGMQGQAVAINGSVTFSGLGEGSHSIQLSDVAANCTVSGDNPRTASITAGQTTGESFGVACAVALFDRIAFNTRRDGNVEIYAMGLDGSNPTRLTNEAHPEWHPAMSPDGTKIAFTRLAFLGDPDSGGIFVIDADGSNAVKLIDSPAFYPSWSPDGSRIAFHTSDTHPDGNAEIYVMDADGSNPTRLTNDTGWDGYPAWSPDGAKIAFTSNRDGNTEIYVMDADGSNATRLTNESARDTKPSWSPDGSKIAFSSLRPGWGIYVMDPDGSNPVLLINEGQDTRPSWSPDGTKIAFTSNRDGNLEIYVLDADGSNLTKLTYEPAADEAPVWSPIR